MVMKPEPWGEALDELADSRTVLVVPTPAGVPFTQSLAAELAVEEHLVFACGRYEGIDQRVVDHAAGRMRVVEVSVGDYVLNGGEVAALAVVEAVVRLLPGFMGNAGSLAEESHGTDGLLEYPVYTKPARWRGLDVPDVLLSGDHGRVAEWRRAQALRRTADRRPDLLHPSRLVTLDAASSAAAAPGDLEWRPRAVPTPARSSPCNGPAGSRRPWPTTCGTSRPCTSRWGRSRPTWGWGRRSCCARRERLVGSVRARLDGTEWLVGRLMVAPDLQGRGLGRWMLERIEEAAPPDARSVGVITGARSVDNLRMYRRAGFRPVRDQPDPRLTRLSKRRRGTPR